MKLILWIRGMTPSWKNCNFSAIFLRFLTYNWKSYGFHYSHLRQKIPYDFHVPHWTRENHEIVLKYIFWKCGKYNRNFLVQNTSNVHINSNNSMTRVTCFFSAALPYVTSSEPLPSCFEHAHYVGVHHFCELKKNQKIILMP